jgi:hypothetical protein
VRLGAGGLDLIQGLQVSQEMNEHSIQDSALAGNNSIKSLIFEYAIIRQKGTSKKYSNVFSVQGSHGSNIDSNRYQIIAVETMMHKMYAIVSPNRGEEWSGILVFYFDEYYVFGIIHT